MVFESVLLFNTIFKNCFLSLRWQKFSASDTSCSMKGNVIPPTRRPATPLMTASWVFREHFTHFLPHGSGEQRPVFQDEKCIPPSPVMKALNGRTARECILQRHAWQLLSFPHCFVEP